MLVLTLFCVTRNLRRNLYFARELAGMFCNADSSVAPHTSSLDSLDSLEKNGLDWVKDLGRKNVEDLLTMIQWNEDNVVCPDCTYCHPSHPIPSI